MKKILSSLILLAAISFAASAQKYNVTNFDLCGIKPLSKLTKAEIIQRFGQPEKIVVDHYPDENTIGASIYYFKDLVLCIEADGTFSDFTVYSSEYPVATSMVNLDGIRVGDSVDVLKRYPFTVPEKCPGNKNCGYRKLDADWYGFYFRDYKDDATGLHVEVKNGKIVSIGIYINCSDA